MIRYALKCAEGHRFESWFQSASAYDKLASAGLVTCAVCDSTSVQKAIMAPRVQPARDTAPVPERDNQSETGNNQSDVATSETPPSAATKTEMVQGHTTGQNLTSEKTEFEKSVSALRKQVETHSDYVGRDFAQQARSMHLGDSPSRAIYGEAKLEEAKDLIEDGVPIVPLPFRVTKKTN